MVNRDRKFAELEEKIENLLKRVAVLEAEEKREAVQGTIRPGVKRGRKSKKKEE